MGLKFEALDSSAQALLRRVPAVSTELARHGVLTSYGREQETAADMEGADRLAGRETLQIGDAHLDHVGVGEPVQGDSIYNGAFDNASGVAALLEMANAFTRLPTPPRRGSRAGRRATRCWSAGRPPCRPVRSAPRQ